MKVHLLGVDHKTVLKTKSFDQSQCNVVCATKYQLSKPSTLMSLDQPAHLLSKIKVD